MRERRTFDDHFRFNPRQPRHDRIKPNAMSPAQQIGLLVPLAYLLGSIPFGLLIGKTKGVDPRKAGSGNIGATNVGRLLGKKFFFIVFILDLLKGFAPMIAAGYVVGVMDETRAKYVLWLAVGFAAIVGHMFSLFLGFKGGKGVATTTGVLLGLIPYYTLAGLIAAAVWIIVFKIWRYVSLASILGTIAFPIAYAGLAKALGWDLFGAQLPLLVFAILMAGLIAFKHRSNIARLRAGTELRATKAGTTPAT
jgi:glycerol-3-phosphate acyltransferase PlsY